MKKLLVCLMGTVAAMAAGAGDVWYANAANYNATYADAAAYTAAGFDGTSAEKGFGTIQIAVDKAASGDTVRVAPGVYDKGVTVDTCENGGHRNRVVIGKTLTLESIGGRAVTHIVGEKDPDTINTSGRFGIGPKAVRGVLVTDGSCVVKIVGFTIRDGACGYSDGKDTLLHWGGGVAVNTSSTGTSSTFNTTLVECRVKDCIATRGGSTRKVNAIRTLYTGSRGANLNNGGIARDGFFAHCVFFSNREYGIADCTLVNCTVIGLMTGNAFDQQTTPCLVYNTYVAYVSHNVGTAAKFYNCALNAADGTQDGYVASTWGEVIAPAAGDFRPKVGGTLVGAAKRDYLDLIPADYRYVDYTGAAIAQSGALSIGAVQEAVAPAGGRLILKDFQIPTIVGTVDGFEKIYYGNMHAYPTVWPTQYVVRVTSADSSKEVWGLSRTQWSDYAFADRDERYYIMPLKSGELYLTPKLADTVFHVDPNPAKGSDANAGSAAAPFRTLQKAADAAADGKYTVVHCAAGTYAEGGATDASGVTNRLYISKWMRFTGAGADKSVIRGAADPAGVTHDGCGSAAVRCVCVATNHVAVQGFTLADGHSSINGTQSSTSMGDAPVLRGGGFLQYSDGLDACLMDCVVSGCVASRGAAVRGGRLIRCHFTGNTLMANSGGNSIIRNCRATACTFFDNNDRAGDILGQSAQYYNCSVVSKTGNRINFQGNTKTYNTLCTSDFDKPALAWGCFNTRTDCAFADASVGDMRITTASKGIGGGVSDGVSDFERYSDGGMDGCRMTFVNGLPICGAYQNPLRRFSVASVLPGDTGVTPSGTVLLAAGETVEVVVTPVATRKYLGVEENGELVPNVTRLTLSGGAYPPDSDEISVAAKYQTDWYVDASKENDSGDGFTPATARKTFEGIFAADVRAGDTVHAAAGEYAAGSMIQTGMLSPKDDDPSPRIRSRVVIPADVALVADAGAEETAIVGASDDHGDIYGRGPNAIRCAYLMDGATLAGFTLKDGNTDGQIGGVELETDNTIGGGLMFAVRDVAARSRVVDCVIANCTAGRGGATYGGTFVRCRFHGNRAVSNGALRNVILYNCYLSGNRSTGATADYLYGAVNCTFAADNLNLAGSGAVAPVGNQLSTTLDVANCLFLSTMPPGNINNLVNCYHLTGLAFKGNKKALNNVPCDPAELTVDAQGHPMIGSNAAIDQADPTLYREEIGGELDCDGNQRVWNGAMDVGAFEADWRPVYARALGRRIIVTKADPEVTLAENGVSVRNGSLEVTYRPRSAESEVVAGASVSGTGSLAIAKDGESVATVTSVRPWAGKFGGSADSMAFAFTHEPGDDDVGSALISRFSCMDGIMLLVR